MPLRSPALAAAAAAALLLAACSTPPVDSIVASGHVETTEILLSSKLSGRLLTVPVREGDAVAAGQVVATLDPVDLDLALSSARAERDRVAAQLALLEAGFRAEEIAEVGAQVEAAGVELAAAERDLARFQGLLDSGSGVEKHRDDALARRDVAARRREGLEQRQRLLERGHRPEEIAVAAAAVAAANARLAQLEQQRADTEIVAPRGGVIRELLAEEGELLAAGGGLAILTDLSDAWLTAWIGEPDLGRVRLGQTAEVSGDGGERRQGTLRSISPRAEFTPKNVQTRDERVKLVYRVEVAIDNRDGTFKPGMPAEARLLPAADESAP